MNDWNNYLDKFFTFHNPFFFAIILSAVVISVLIIIYIKFFFPLQKKLVLESQRYLTEKAELMALFAEMDPDPLIRIDSKGNIIQTNEEARKIFRDIEKKGRSIKDFLPSAEKNIIDNVDEYLETIEGKVYSVCVKRKAGLSFTNIYMHDITTLKKYELLQADNQNRLKLLTEKLDNEIEELKNNLSMDLHDDIGQRLLMTNLKLADTEKFSGQEVKKDIDFIYNRIREISRLLKPADISNLGLKLSLQSLVGSISKSSNIKASFEFYGEEENIDTIILTCIYRIVQEAINNIVKHSKAEEFSIQLSIKEDRINLIITDDGRGIPEDYFSASGTSIYGTGLFSMRERIKKFDGTLKIESDPENGTNLFIEIPLGKNEKE